ncbi:MAG: response regulator [Methanomassiliicoccales archaeon]
MMIEVLIVDGDEKVVELVQSHLQSDGDIYATSVNSALAALKAVRYWDYDVIISGMIFSSGNGVELLRSLRRQGNQIPFIFFAHDDLEALQFEIEAHHGCILIPRNGNFKARLFELKRTVRALMKPGASLRNDAFCETMTSVIDTYAHDDELDRLCHEDLIPDWMRGISHNECDDAGDIYDYPEQTFTDIKAPDYPSIHGEMSELRDDENKACTYDWKRRWSQKKMVARRGGGLKLLREDASLRGDEEIFRIQSGSKHDRWNP